MNDMASSALELVGISKSFAGVRARNCRPSDS